MILNYKINKRIIIVLLIIVLLVAFCIWQNNSMVISQFAYTSSKIPNAFDGFKILQISDLHNKNFGCKQSYLMKKVKEASPDIIVITGDIVDRRHYDLETAISVVKQAAEIAPVYYASGNHEARTGKYDEIKNKLEGAGATVLDNESVAYKLDGSSISIIGLKDPRFLPSGYLDGPDTRQMEACLDNYKESSQLKIVLSHRPELMYMYKMYNADIVFSGHAHGGQIRLPFVGGIVAPGQGFFPKYDAGEYIEGSTTMYVSRGLGSSIFPLRVFNRPELVVVALER